jgi:hypothetical protein
MSGFFNFYQSAWPSMAKSRKMSFGFVAAIRGHDLSADGWHEFETFRNAVFAANKSIRQAHQMPDYRADKTDLLPCWKPAGNLGWDEVR